MFSLARAFFFFAWLGAGAVQPLAAQELSLLAGSMGTRHLGGKSYAWELEYRQELARHLAWSAAWINEGHDTLHHRDGVAGQAWLTTGPVAENLSFAAGLGVYHYSDTQLLPGDTSYNVHGWTPIYSASATYRTGSPWLFRLTANRIQRAADLQTNTIVIGVGYELRTGSDPRPPSETAGNGPRATTANEFTVFVGKSIVNTTFSEDADAIVAEYRRGLIDHLDGTISWLNEGDPRVIRRHGIASQLWLVDDFLAHHFTLGLGAGPYWYFDRKPDPSGRNDHDGEFAAVISPTASYRFGEHWVARLTWNRVMSHYNRDADVIVLGAGFRWSAHLP